MELRSIAPTRPSATVVLFRETLDCGEVLLVRRSGRLDFHGGAWVFPGGRVDDEEVRAAGGDLVAAARAAAVREVEEETGLAITISELVPISRWTTPIESPKRFLTWFFLARTEAGGEVCVDGCEIVGSRWIRPADALREQSEGTLDIPPPTFVTLLGLSRARSISDYQAERAGLPPEVFEPKIVVDEQGFFSLYAGDAGFEDRDVAKPGARHRLYSTHAGWCYEREGC